MSQTSSSLLFVKTVGGWFRTICLVNFLLGQAKMSIWLNRRNKMKETGSVDLELMFRGLVAARLRI